MIDEFLKTQVANALLAYQPIKKTANELKTIQNVEIKDRWIQNKSKEFVH